MRFSIYLLNHPVGMVRRASEPAKMEGAQTLPARGVKIPYTVVSNQENTP